MPQADQTATAGTSSAHSSTSRRCHPSGSPSSRGTTEGQSAGSPPRRPGISGQSGRIAGGRGCCFVAIRRIRPGFIARRRRTHSRAVLPMRKPRGPAQTPGGSAFNGGLSASEAGAGGEAGTATAGEGPNEADAGLIYGVVEWKVGADKWEQKIELQGQEGR
jgi:hypothetical protein